MRDTGGVAPQQHLEWFADNITWFQSISSTDLTREVPNCPGWTVESVLNHLSFGLGLGYQVALSKGPDTPAEDAFDGVAWPEDYPSGVSTFAVFADNMGQCLSAFLATDPDTACWTYAGAGTAAFWFRRAAIETALHRIDVEEALRQPPVLEAERMVDAIAETIEFALPLAASMAGAPEGRLTVTSPELSVEHRLGSGTRHGFVTGSGQDVLAALWGRHRDRVQVTGDENIANEWLSRIDQAFANR